MELIEQGLDPTEFGNLSSIMINPNEISNAVYASNMLPSTKAGENRPSIVNFNFMKEMEKDENNNGRMSLFSPHAGNNNNNL